MAASLLTSPHSLQSSVGGRLRAAGRVVRVLHPVSIVGWIRRFIWHARTFLASNDPQFRTAYPVFLLIAGLLFVRSPTSNCIFDEQEALLANPYVNGRNLGWLDVVHRDFWGLPASRSIGSYRPLPDLIWRALWPLGQSPWLLHLINVIVHAATAALLASFVLAFSRRRFLGWWTGLAYVTFAVLTEAVSGVVGLADVLGAMFVAIALQALRLKGQWSPLVVFPAVLLGLFSKESVLVAVPLLPVAALFSAHYLHPNRPRAWMRTTLGLVAPVAALIAYTELRRHWFPVNNGTEPVASLSVRSPELGALLQSFLRWFRQPHLPVDGMNNPLASAEPARRIAGALGIFAEGFAQLLVPTSLSGDYSFSAEPVPARLVQLRSVAGGLLLVALPLLSGLALVFDARGGQRGHESTRRNAESNPAGGSSIFARPRLRILGLAAWWIPVAYLPHSNLFVLLPTIRAERFWVIPALGAAMAVGVGLDWLSTLDGKWSRRIGATLIVVYLGFQGVQARGHALDYTDDLTFWQSTVRAEPNSAKARLNYAVMLGTRQRMQERLDQGRIAIEIAPNWPMAQVYQGDALCRLERLKQAWPYYRRGFELGPNEPNLIALGLQCLWDHHQIQSHREELLDLADRHPGSWLAFLATDILTDGKKYDGVQKQYRPRGYNEGPKNK